MLAATSPSFPRRLVKRLSIGIDVGGTFTDLCAVTETGEVRVVKVSSTHPDPAAGILEGIRQLCAETPYQLDLRLGTTAGLNAVLERKGARTALITTQGFRDIYELGRGDRPDMYNLHYHRVRPLVPPEGIFELPERMAADGSVLKPLEVAEAKRIAGELTEGDYESVAICLLHSYRNPAHELALAAILRQEAPRCAASLSHQVAREWREFERTSTTVLDAYIRPILESHLKTLTSTLEAEGHDASITLMRSSGGLMPTLTDSLEPVTVLLSGPVGGAVASRALAKRLDLGSVVAMDMGGTSFDVTLLADGELSTTHQTSIEGFPLLSTSVAVHTIGAGGGSMVWLEGGGLRVGPQSAGSKPGPVCYGRGGQEATVTDANACLGRIGTGQFLGGDFKLDAEAARAMFKTVARTLSLPPEHLLEGVIDIVNARMVSAIRLLTTEQSLDVRDFSLIAYGGNGPIHAAALAEALGVRRVVVPAYPGAFSAWGMLHSEVRKDYVLPFLQTQVTLELSALSNALTFLQTEAHSFLEDLDIRPEQGRYLWRADMRYQGQEHYVAVPLPSPPISSKYVTAVVSSFHELHQQLYGHSHRDQTVEFVNLRLSVLGPAPTIDSAPATLQKTMPEAQARAVLYRGQSLNVPVYRRETLKNKTYIGPLIVEELTATTFVPPNWILEREPETCCLLLHPSGTP